MNKILERGEDGSNKRQTGSDVSQRQEKQRTARIEDTTYLRLLYTRRYLSAGDMRVPGMMSLELRLRREASSGLGRKVRGVVRLLLNNDTNKKCD